MDLAWNDLYIIGNERIDSEHKNLFKIAAEAFCVVDPKQKIKKIKAIVEKLLNYTKKHFAHEESFMESTAYPELDEHRIKHQIIVLSMNKFLKNITKMNPAEIEKELANFIKIWFISHIINEDKKISHWVKSQNATGDIFFWKNSYSINNEFIDAEHKKLFFIASEIFEDVPLREKRKKIVETLKRLFHYLNEHFSNEEEYMKNIKYDKLEEHKVIHVNIMENLSQLIRNSTKLSTEKTQENIENFIETSLVEHIMQEDKKIANWVQFLNDLKEVKKLEDMV